MTDEQANEKDEKEDENITPVADPVAEQIAADVKDRLEHAQETGEIRQKVVDHFAKEKIDERTKLLTSALVKRAEKKKELDKTKPDRVDYDENGKVVSSRWTKDHLKKRNELQKALNKMDKAIQRAVKSADYEGLKKFAK